VPLQLINVCAGFSFEKYVILGRIIYDLSQGFWKESQKEKELADDLDVGGRKILKCILKK
jgi:hypothetical protein